MQSVQSSRGVMSGVGQESQRRVQSMQGQSQRGAETERTSEQSPQEFTIIGKEAEQS